MRKDDKLLETVHNAIVKDNVNGLHIYFSYETPDEVAHIEIYDTWVNKVIDSYTDYRMTIGLISKDYPQFFKTNK
jgi:hypothetical protein